MHSWIELRRIFAENSLFRPPSASIQLSSHNYPVFEPRLTYNFFEAESKATPFLIEISPYGRSSD